MLALILGALPALATAVVTAYNKTKDVTIASYQMAVGLAQASVSGMTAWLGHPLSAPSLLAYAVAGYYGKAIFYDNVVSFWITGHAGYTPSLTESTATVAAVVVAGMFVCGIPVLLRK